MRYWKNLKGGQSIDGGNFDWTLHLPKDGNLGLDLPFRPAKVCETGWHFTTDLGLRAWLKHPELYIALPTGKSSVRSYDGTAHKDKASFEGGCLGPRVLVNEAVFATFALEALNLLPIKGMSPEYRNALAAFKGDMIDIVVGVTASCDLDTNGDADSVNDFIEDIEGVYNDFTRTMPPALVAEFRALRLASDTRLDVLRRAFADSQGSVPYLVECVPDAIFELHRHWKGPLKTRSAVFEFLGDVLEYETIK